MNSTSKSVRRHVRHARQRNGVASIEFAMVLPLLMILTLGTIDVCSVIFLRESATLAAYEGARQGIGRGNTNADVVARVQQFLNERDINFGGNVVQVSAPGFAAAETLENVTVTVNIPAQGNLLIPTDRFAALIVSASCTMRKEYKNLSN